jgi:sulfate adenylyltransferase (ADP) / ATP adenylyltransferase
MSSPAEAALVRQARAVAARALAGGALQPIRTHEATVTDRGLPFRVRVVDSLARKAAARREPQARANPFLPYDPALFVAELSDRHVVLLNKYPVLEDHLLIVTRRFEEQETPLSAEDFAALCHCLAQMDGLGFYNAGVAAGASQRHKHLQLVPRPAPGGLPLEPEVHAALEIGALATPLPFRHALAPLDPDWLDDPAAAGLRLAQIYERLLAVVGRGGGRGYGRYNLLVTRDWMMAVPRTQEAHAGVSVNALGFAGLLLARDAAQLEQIRRLGPLRLLRGVTETAC